MRKRLSSLLLMGTATVGTITAGAMPAQVTPAQPKYPLNVTVTYNATLSNVITSSHFWMQGGSVQIHGQLWRGWGVAADIAGAQAGNVNASGVGLDMVTATFGPRYTWSPAHQRYALFGQVLAGIAKGFNSVFPAATGAISSNNSLALVLGGGMNVALSRHVAVRALDADWLRTQLPNGTTNVQNNLRLGAGVVFRFR
jgi:hypothetical protein